ncbi:MAG: M48 family metalloprotease [Solirubrobacterales bacterium]|nr:M48 family metalloprotease [Solirubrobacterales bacterium]
MHVPRALAVRMVLVAVLNPLVALGLFVAVIVFMPSRYLPMLFVALIIGTGARSVRLFTNPRGKRIERNLSEADDPELFGLLHRLCALADLPEPAVVLREQDLVNSWVVHLPGKPPRLYLTTGLREALTLEELQAVLGHELSHIANRDALVMTVVGAPAAMMSHTSGAGGLDGILVAAIGLICQLGTTLLSRYREFAADAGASAMTGRPSALASALLKVSSSFEQIPRKDLRSAAALGAFNLVALPRRGWLLTRTPLARMTATHPPLQARLDALHALERAQQLGRP